MKQPPRSRDFLPLSHRQAQYRKPEDSQVRTRSPVEETSAAAESGSGMPRSKANTGRKGQPLPPEMAHYADRLRRTFADRKEKDGLTQKEIAKRSGLSQSVISEAMDVEKPKIGITASVIVRICMAMDVSTDFVLMGIGDEIPRLARRSAASPTPGGVELREAAAPMAPPPEPPEPPSTSEQTAPPPRTRKSGSP